MSLDKLKEIKQEAERHAAERRASDRGAEYLSGVRRGDIYKNPVEALVAIHSRGYGGYPKARDALNEALSAVLPDILRIAELNLSARSRESQVRAAQLEAVIAASILPLPDLGGDV